MLVDVMLKEHKEPKQPKRPANRTYKNVKVPITKSELKKIRMNADVEQITVTDYAEKLIREGFERYYIADLEEHHYEDTKRYVNAWLRPREHDRLKELSYEYGVSIRRAAHRILTHMLEGGVYIR